MQKDNNKLVYLILAIVIILATIVGWGFFKIQNIQKDIYSQKLIETIKYNKFEAEIKSLNNRLSELESFEDKPTLTRYIQKVNPKVFYQLAEIQAGTFIKCSKTYNLPIGVLVGLADVESKYRHDVVSNKGAIGILQVNPTIWTNELVKKGLIFDKMDLYDPVRNIHCGSYILSKYQTESKKGDPMKFALTRYLGGTKNNHYLNVMKACGEYYLFIKRAQTKK